MSAFELLLLACLKVQLLVLFVVVMCEHKARNAAFKHGAMAYAKIEKFVAEVVGPINFKAIVLWVLEFLRDLIVATIKFAAKSDDSEVKEIEMDTFEPRMIGPQTDEDWVFVN